jgi:hypothetical protein
MPKLMVTVSPPAPNKVSSTLTNDKIGPSSAHPSEYPASSGTSDAQPSPISPLAHGSAIPFDVRIGHPSRNQNRSRANPTDLNYRREDLSSNVNAPLRYVCEIELPAYLDPKSHWANVPRWGIAKLDGGNSNEGDVRKDAGVGRNGGNGQEAKDDVCKVEVMEIESMLDPTPRLQHVSVNVEEGNGQEQAASFSTPSSHTHTDSREHSSSNTPFAALIPRPSSSLQPPTQSQSSNSSKTPKQSPTPSSSDRQNCTFTITNTFTSPLPLCEWTRTKVYKDDVHQGNEGVWMALMGKFCPTADDLGNGVAGVSGEGVLGDGATSGITLSYVTEALPAILKKKLRPGTGVGKSIPR